jgi:hypothetical protein
VRVFLKVKAWLFGLRDHVEVVGTGQMNLVTREQAASAGGALDPAELALDAAVAKGPSGLSPEDPGPAVVPATVLARSTSDSASEPREADQIAVSPAATVVEFLVARLADDESALTCRGLPLPLHSTSYSDPSERDVAATRSLIAGCSAIFDPAAGWESEEARRLAKRILGHLAAIYSDHSDFREEWRPNHDVPHESRGTVSLVWPLRSIDTSQ